EDPAVRSMRPDHRAEQGGRERKSDPSGMEADKDKGATDRLRGEGGIGEPAGKSDGFEIACRSGQTVGEELQDDAVGEIHGSEADAQERDAPIGGLGVHGKSPLDTGCNCIYMLSLAL